MLLELFVCVPKRLEVEVHQASRIEHIGHGKKNKAVFLIELRCLPGQFHAAVGAGHHDQRFVLSPISGIEDAFKPFCPYICLFRLNVHFLDL